MQDKSSGFHDNDSLAKELAKELNAELLVLLTNVDGLMDGHPRDRTSKYVLWLLQPFPWLDSLWHLSKSLMFFGVNLHLSHN